MIVSMLPTSETALAASSPKIGTRLTGVSICAARVTLCIAHASLDKFNISRLRTRLTYLSVLVKIIDIDVEKIDYGHDMTMEITESAHVPREATHLLPFVDLKDC